ncbi:hypothetical protein [Chryseobacterium arthrosphaerae]|uniref:hypothetical protein n=1 Tax=Chryseobacterium arthrosphaerae TaxID=651561 RepID=UPI00241D1E82|nr:hypothetical protein [Chryseobacterium arthrosphaerae]
MKKVLLMACVLAIHFTSAQLYTSTGTVGSTTTPTSKNVGIGVHDPHSNLEVGDQNGGKITISTGGWSASSASPKYPTLEFAGYLNSPKVRLTATEESGNTNGSKFSILVNDNTNTANLVERFSILQNGNIGIGITNPTQKLDIKGSILAGSTHSTEGINAFAIRYEGGSLSNWGSLRSSAATYMSFGVKADPNTTEGWLSSNGNLNFSKIALTMNNDGFSFFTAPYQQIAIDSPVSMKEVMKISVYGNALLQGKLEAKELKVTLTPTADFVFDDKYNLPTLEDIERHIKEKKHLPEIASAKVMEKEGVNVGEFQIRLLQKIEELTLYSIDQNKKIKQQSEQLKQIQNENEILKAQSAKIQQLEQQVQQLLSTQK